MFSFEEGNTTTLGAILSADGVNFAVFSEHADALELCLFDDQGIDEIQRIPFFKGSDYIWSVKVIDLKVGAKYGLRAYGAFDPEAGLFFDETTLLIDPYARKLDRSFQWQLNDNVAEPPQIVPRCIVTARKSAEEIAKTLDSKPSTPWQDTIIYEAHTRGMTQLNQRIPENLRGTYSGISHQNNVEYLKSLGVTALELLPVHAFIDEKFLVERQLTNYWGYNTLNFFCPHLAYAQSDANREFSEMVDTLHAAGIEVILDVVYNHTAEAGAEGPTLSFKGLDALNYYRFSNEAPRQFINDTGCGNTVQVDHPRVMQLIMDSLRYWAGEMGVDGFRFDLASILGRDSKGFSQRAAFFQAVAQDPILSTCKLIAEPWDIGPGGYQLGAFPGRWSEWNDRYRDVCRRFWRGEAGLVSEFAKRLHGSSDKFEHNCRSPYASVNFITSHDGFTLADLVSFKERHNEANTENNADGHHANFSDNYGIEGATDDPEILKIRRRQQRNFIATLFLSQGTPMLLGGDELGRTQGGNNNAYCQDNEINWIDWEILKKENDDLLDFSKAMIGLRKDLQDFFPSQFIHNQDQSKFSAYWLSPSGDHMVDKDWHKKDLCFIACMIHLQEGNKHRRALFIFNAGKNAETFCLPTKDAWQRCLNTSNEINPFKQRVAVRKNTIAVQPQSVQVLVANAL